MTIGSAALAQPATSGEPSSEWRLAAGRDVAALRDISGTGIPVDASPVAWRGTGVGITLEHARTRGRWTREIAAAVTRAASFHYTGAGPAEDRSPDDRFTRLALGIEWQRQVISHAWLRGLSLSAGLRAGVLRTTVAKHMPVDIRMTESRTGGLTALVVLMEFRRGRGPGVEVRWANGGHIGHLAARHSSDQVRRTQWGGGWVSDLAVLGDIPVGARTAIVARYVRSHDGTLSSHRSVAATRSSLTVGMSYAR